MTIRAKWFRPGIGFGAYVGFTLATFQFWTPQYWAVLLGLCFIGSLIMVVVDRLEAK